MEVIDVSAHEPRRIPSKKWRELIKKVWEADRCGARTAHGEMRIVSLIDQEDVIERILRHLGLWQEGVRWHRFHPLRQCPLPLMTWARLIATRLWAMMHQPTCLSNPIWPL